MVTLNATKLPFTPAEHHFHLLPLILPPLFAVKGCLVTADIQNIKIRTSLTLQKTPWSVNVAHSLLLAQERMRTFYQPQIVDDVWFTKGLLQFLKEPTVAILEKDDKTAAQRRYLESGSETDRLTKPTKFLLYL
jgi:hypothetical protein